MSDPDPKDASYDQVKEELEEIRDTAGELRPEEDLTWANLPNTDHGFCDYD